MFADPISVRLQFNSTNTHIITQLGLFPGFHLSYGRRFIPIRYGIRIELMQPRRVVLLIRLETINTECTRRWKLKSLPQQLLSPSSSMHFFGPHPLRDFGEFYQHICTTLNDCIPHRRRRTICNSHNNQSIVNLEHFAAQIIQPGLTGCGRSTSTHPVSIQQCTMQFRNEDKRNFARYQIRT